MKVEGARVVHLNLCEVCLMRQATAEAVWLLVDRNIEVTRFVCPDCFRLLMSKAPGGDVELLQLDELIPFQGLNA